MTFVKKFYVSDTHIGHERMLSMQPRPFSSIEEHDEYIETAWNSVVGDDDIVYHLGDFAFNLSRDADRIRGVFMRLKGRKFLVVGNHDVDKRGHLHPTLAGARLGGTSGACTTDHGRRPRFVAVTLRCTVLAEPALRLRPLLRSLARQASGSRAFSGRRCRHARRLFSTEAI